MIREVRLTPDAQTDLRRISNERAQQVIAALRRSASTNQGDIKATKGRLAGGYRLRIGEFRVRFHIQEEANAVVVVAVSARGGAHKE